jgi:hypothetical protein
MKASKTAMPYPISEETIVQDYCMGCRLRQVASNDQERRDCTDCYTTLRNGMEDVGTIERYKIK